MAAYTPQAPSVLHQTAALTHSQAHAFLSAFLTRAAIDPSCRPDSTLSERGPQSNSSAGNPNLTLHHLNRIKLGLEGTRLGVEELDAAFFGGAAFGGAASRKRKCNDHEVDKVGLHRADGESSSRSGGGQMKRAGETDSGPQQSRHSVVSQEDGHGPGGDRAEDDAEDDAEAAVVVAAEGDGWQDREDYELAQDDNEVDIGNAQRNPAAAPPPAMDDDGVEDQDDGSATAIPPTVKMPSSPPTITTTTSRKNKTVVDKAERKRHKQERSKKLKKTALQSSP